MARPTKLTPELHAAIIKGLLSCCFVTEVCEANGIDRRTYERWMRAGEDTLDEQTGAILTRGRKPYRAFRRDVVRTQAMVEMFLSSQVVKATKDDWAAAKWLLSVRFRSRWGGEKEAPAEGSTPVREIRVTFGGRYLPDGRLARPRGDRSAPADLDLVPVKVEPA
jgi:hypothetical protein